MRRLGFGLVVSFAAAFVVGSCGETACDCASGVVGLVITTGAPVTAVTLSGPACAAGRFRCVPDDFDATIHGDCMEVQVEAAAAGTCIVDLTVGGTIVRVAREMAQRPPGCCGDFIGEQGGTGEIDLRTATTAP